MKFGRNVKEYDCYPYAKFRVDMSQFEATIVDATYRAPISTHMSRSILEHLQVTFLGALNHYKKFNMTCICMPIFASIGWIHMDEQCHLCPFCLLLLVVMTSHCVTGRHKWTPCRRRHSCSEDAVCENHKGSEYINALIIQELEWGTCRWNRKGLCRYV